MIKYDSLLESLDVSCVGMCVPDHQHSLLFLCSSPAPKAADFLQIKNEIKTRSEFGLNTNGTNLMKENNNNINPKILTKVKKSIHLTPFPLSADLYDKWVHRKNHITTV